MGPYIFIGHISLESEMLYFNLFHCKIRPVGCVCAELGRKPSLRAFTAQDILLRAYVSLNLFTNAFIIKIYENKNKYLKKINSFYKTRM